MNHFFWEIKAKVRSVKEKIPLLNLVTTLFIPTTSLTKQPGCPPYSAPIRRAAEIVHNILLHNLYQIIIGCQQYSPGF